MPNSGIYKEMAKQTRQAVAEADVVIFVVDAREGLSAQDHDIANDLRRLGKPCRAGGQQGRGHAGRRAAGRVLRARAWATCTASRRRTGRASAAWSSWRSSRSTCPSPTTRPRRNETGKPIKLAVAGRPNVGKSTLINTWLGEERLVAFDLPGTTRDAIAVPFERNGQKFELIDTAGLRRKGKVFEAIEKFSVVKTLQAIESANVVLLLLDATQGVTDQDAHIAGYILECGPRGGDRRSTSGTRSTATSASSCSARSRRGWPSSSSRRCISSRPRSARAWARCGGSIAQAHQSATRKMSTPVLTRLLLEAVQFQAPKRAGMFRPKLRYAHQGGMNPPVIVVHGNSLEHVTDAYKRFLEGRFRKEFELVGTPLRIEMKTSHNPYADKD